MADTAQTLIDAATALGYDSLSDRGIQECLLYAASSGGGGGGGTGAVLTGTVDPTDPPTDADAGALYYNTSTGVIWQWDTDTDTWG